MTKTNLSASDTRLLDALAFALASAGLDRAADAIYNAFMPDEEPATVAPLVTRTGNVIKLHFPPRQH